MQPFDTWRAEISRELEAERANLAVAAEEAWTANQALRDAREAHKPIETAMGSLKPEQVAGAIARRYADYRERITNAERGVSRTRQRLDALRYNVANLEIALGQIDRINEINPPNIVAEQAATAAG